LASENVPNGLKSVSVTSANSTQWVNVCQRGFKPKLPDITDSEAGRAGFSLVFVKVYKISISPRDRYING